MEQVTYVEMCNLAFQGAKVIHPRAVEIAMQNSTPIRIRSTMSDHPGTLVTHRSEIDRLVREVRENTIIGVTQMPNVNSGENPAETRAIPYTVESFQSDGGSWDQCRFYQRQPERNCLYGL